jgi:hypothetical protein
VATSQIQVQRFSPYGNEEALKVARDLDSKVESPLTAAAA